MKIQKMTKKLAQVSDIYSKKFSIERDEDWFILKIQEELGELSSAHLKLTHRGRIGKKSKRSLEQNLEDEIADVLAMTLLFAEKKGIDAERALKRKWLKHLPK